MSSNMLFSALAILFLPLCKAFAIDAPSQVKVNEPFLVNWTRFSRENPTVGWALILGNGAANVSQQILSNQGAVLPGEGQAPFNVDTPGVYTCSAYWGSPGPVQFVVSSNEITAIQAQPVSQPGPSSSSNGVTQGSSSTVTSTSSKPLQQTTSTSSRTPSVTAATTTSSSSDLFTSQSFNSSSSTTPSATLTDGQSVTQAVTITSNGTVTGSTSTSAAPAITPPVTAKSSRKEGVIIGTTLGLVALLSVLAAAILIRRRHQSKSSPSALFSQNDTSSAGVTPFIETKDGPILSSAGTSSVVTPFTETKNGRIFYPSKLAPSRVYFPSPQEPVEADAATEVSAPSIVSGSVMTERQRMVQSRLDQLIVALQTALAAAHEDDQTGASDLQVEIERLGQVLQSDWALGLTDEPPPAYSQLMGGSESHSWQ